MYTLASVFLSSRIDADSSRDYSACISGSMRFYKRLSFLYLFGLMRIHPAIIVPVSSRIDADSPSDYRSCDSSDWCGFISGLSFSYLSGWMRIHPAIAIVADSSLAFLMNHSGKPRGRQSSGVNVDTYLCVNMNGAGGLEDDSSWNITQINVAPRLEWPVLLRASTREAASELRRILRVVQQCHTCSVV